MISLLIWLNLLNHLALLTAYYDVIIILESHDLSQPISSQTDAPYTRPTLGKSVDLENYKLMFSVPAPHNIAWHVLTRWNHNSKQPHPTLSLLILTPKANYSIHSIVLSNLILITSNTLNSKYQNLPVQAGLSLYTQFTLLRFQRITF